MYRRNGVKNSHFGLDTPLTGYSSPRAAPRGSGMAAFVWVWTLEQRR